ncbi:ester cyclase [Kitasatospora sp. NPDC003701]
MTRIADNRETVRAFIDALFTKGDLTAVDEYLAEDFLNHDPPFGSDTGREGMRGAAALFRGAFPDWHATPDFLVAENDMVVEHFSATGTQLGEILGAPATGRTVTLRGINIFRVREGRIVERWGRLDELGLLRQLGLAQGPG